MLRRPPDVVQMIVDIFGSTSLFVAEYKSLLAAKLLKPPADPTQPKELDILKEDRSLELLKLRFGEGAMLPCEIMVKDVKDSQRLQRDLLYQVKHAREQVKLKPEGEEKEEKKPTADKWGGMSAAEPSIENVDLKVLHQDFSRCV